MKYTIRHVRKFIEQGKIDPQLWKTHFPTILESQVPTCNECEDLKNNLCQGGKTPVDCFLGVQVETEKKAGTAGQKTKKELHKKFYPGHRDKNDGIPSGANITFDQSKQ
jgi:hypothetical protein